MSVAFEVTWDDGHPPTRCRTIAQAARAEKYSSRQTMRPDETQPDVWHIMRSNYSKKKGMLIHEEVYSHVGTVRIVNV
jgi:hypothetical protein